MEKLVRTLKDRGDIKVIEYFFLAVLIVAGIIVALFRYIL
jgi:hypothetical protein